MDSSNSSSSSGSLAGSYSRSRSLSLNTASVSLVSRAISTKHTHLDTLFQRPTPTVLVLASLFFTFLPRQTVTMKIVLQFEKLFCFLGYFFFLLYRDQCDTFFLNSHSVLFYCDIYIYSFMTTLFFLFFNRFFLFECIFLGCIFFTKTFFTFVMCT